MEGSALVGRKGPGAGKEIVVDRRGKSGRIGTVLEAFKKGPRNLSGILNSDRTSSHSFLPAHRRPFSFFAPFPCSSAHGRGWEELRLGRGARGWQLEP
jgi:hypothetical protein